LGDIAFSGFTGGYRAGTFQNTSIAYGSVFNAILDNFSGTKDITNVARGELAQI
jgi:hypothetical protein